ncbi:disease resistance protein [Tripterygium wilfordii]|uniref:Disease resistance protein n=1 Tax=Tripterygium wilfordii TaxID=458696 RepID=A0A7J7D5Y4_TRIWF|nr:disease resistance protein RFL1 [Tripterygium wilfordii]KAF5741723.1 disease resistance protein [Tripterygium wilfordii]
MGNAISVRLSAGSIVSKCSDCIVGEAMYMYKLKENLEDLRTTLEDLKSLRNDVNRKVNIAEEQHLQRLDQVQGWLSRADAMINEVEELLQDDSTETRSACLGVCCSKNCMSSYKFGKKVAKKLKEIEDLKSKGAFQEVAQTIPAPSVVEIPHEPAVGLESTFDEAWRCIVGKEIGVIGLYGVGGVGKTTLLKQINNNFLDALNDFDVVIWVVVSKDLNYEKIQEQIGEKIGFKEDVWRTKSIHQKAADIFKVLSKRRFALLLDDIWERVDLIKVGVPVPNEHNGSKIVFTTRSEEVCGRMGAQRRIRVRCLTWEEAWKLFKQNVGDDIPNSHPEIPALAETVARECGGLPLALITLGRAMACKRTPQEWYHATEALRRSASELTGMGNEVFPLLRFSYDSLPNTRVQDCFLYCALFPEDFPIPKVDLIECWVSEDLLDEYDDQTIFQNQGHDIIGTLVHACLLEEDRDDRVKMHDVNRDMALWIARDQYLVAAGARLVEPPNLKRCEGLQKISLMANHIENLRRVPTCPKLLTLFLGDNRLQRIAGDFFQFTPTLKVLDLSRNHKLTELPSAVSSLVSLQHLNLSFTGIKELPIELKYLEKLKYLNLEYTNALTTIPEQLVSCFRMLQILRLFECGPLNVQSDILLACNESLVRELQSLSHLNVFTISIKSLTALQIFLSIQSLVSNTQSLSFQYMSGLGRMNMSDLARIFKDLDKLFICDSNHLRELPFDLPLGFGRELHNSLIRSGACFRNLRHVRIMSCQALQEVTWLIFAPNIMFLAVVNCYNIKEIISVEKLGGDKERVRNLDLFARLRVLNVSALQQLESIYWDPLPFPNVDQIVVIGCPKLRTLPNADRARGPKFIIYGQAELWKQLEWENEATRDAFYPYFRCA